MIMRIILLLAFVSLCIIDRVSAENAPREPNIAVVVVLDKSASMKRSDRIGQAREALNSLIVTLREEDLIGITAFDEAPFVILPLRKVRDQRAIAAKRIEHILPAGRTNLFPALTQATEALRQAKAREKHIVVVTDGGKRQEPQDEGFSELVSDCYGQGITLSAVLLAKESDFGFLRTLVEKGGGQFYQTTERKALARILVDDVAAVRSRETTKYSQQP